MPLRVSTRRAICRPCRRHMAGEFMQVDKNSDVFSNFISNFFRKFQDTSGLELFSVKASQVEQDAKAIEDNHRNPTPEGGKRAEMLRVPKPDFHEFKQGYRFDRQKSTGRT